MCKDSVCSGVLAIQLPQKYQSYWNNFSLCCFVNLGMQLTLIDKVLQNISLYNLKPHNQI